MEFTSFHLCDKPVLSFSSRAGILTTNNFLAKVDSDQGGVYSILPAEVVEGRLVKVDSARGSRKDVAFCLDSEGKLSVVCLCTLLVIDVWKEVT
jgi:hypothetical protein